MAKKYGADKLWIVNVSLYHESHFDNSPYIQVGDLKPHEISLDFFMTYAWNTTIWSKDDMDKYRQQWALREFGSEELAPRIADILKRYSRLKHRSKDELLNSTTYSAINYRE